ncbi:histone deacetylase [Silanimonas sp.]|jgi:acetoin utilization deacetylase AcuC-like enzyme|uniref:histone deacetylase family protein n=1 Tax=Silanimonas sp. TaxID=1929290 RepID=UPI0022CBE1B9|nr:histone deacetylase [Silanimonas sp.]MCZ8166007.1 histone deacetylase [Silanimonas sp.]
MKAFFCPTFELPLPEGHAFPMAKYRRLYERVREHAERWGVTLHEPVSASDEALRRVHCPDYIERVRGGTLSPQEQRRIGFPWSDAMAKRARRTVGGTIAALDAALRGDGVAVNLAGGTHHAAFDRGGGYCIFNDAVVAARHVQAEGLAQRLLIVDLDVHHGNGTAELVAGDDTLFAFSMHDAKNYPAIKPASDLDVPLPPGTDDARYLDLLAAHLPRAVDAARPEAVIYLAGADPFVGDRLGQLALTKAGLAQRDRAVFEACRRHGLPLSVAMAGGYAPDVDDIVDIHAETVRLAARAACAAIAACAATS